VGHVAHVAKKGNSCQGLVGKREKRPLEGPRRRWELINLTEIRRGGVGCSHLPQDRGH
jgi:hypothetical protein